MFEKSINVRAELVRGEGGIDLHLCESLLSVTNRSMDLRATLCKQLPQDRPMTAILVLAITPNRKIRRMRQRRENIEDTYALRLKVQGGGCSGFSYDLYFDQVQETDRGFDVKGVKLVCDEMSLMYLVGTEIDYVEGLHGAGFKFNNPNVKSTCGCGSSFSV